MPKVYRSDVRQIILKIKEYFEEEKRLNGPAIPFAKINDRIVAATGISINTVSKIIKEGKEAASTSSKVVTPSKKRNRRKDKVEMDNFDLGVLRRKVHEFYAVKKELPTLKKLLSELRKDINFQGSREILRQHLKKNGFTYKKTNSNRKVLMEKNDIAAWRIKYLQALKNNQLTEKRPVIYIDETYIHSGHTAGKSWQSNDTVGVLEPISKGQRWIIVHAGGKQGFVENGALIFKSKTKSGDYHDDMNFDNFKKWLTDKFIPNLKEPSLIVMDNAPYHSVQINKPPNANSNKKDIADWLTKNNVNFQSNLTKPQLLEIVQKNKPEPIYAVDNLLRDNGHKVLRLPPYHCDLNPIEMVWASMKRKVAEKNIGKPPSEMPNIVMSAFDAISISEWQNYCSHVNKIEEDYSIRDLYLDEPFIIHLQSDSETDSDSYGENFENSSDEDSFDSFRPLNIVTQEHNYSKIF